MAHELTKGFEWAGTDTDIAIADDFEVILNLTTNVAYHADSWSEIWNMKEQFYAQMLGWV